MQTRPVDGAFGIEISGLDPVAITGADATALRTLLTRHRVLVFRDVEMTPAQHVEFMTRFGRIMIEMPDDTDPDRLGGKVSYVTTRPDEYISGHGGLGFHADFSWSVDGAEAVFSLYALIVDREAPTVFADMAKALQRVPDAMREQLRDLELVKCVNFYHNQAEDFGPRYRLCHRDPAKDYGPTVSVAPAIIRHPRSGEEILNVCQTFTSHVLGWTYDESDGLFAALESHQYAKDLQYRHRWRRGDLVLWDNLALQHGRAPVSEGATRHLQRVICKEQDFADLLGNNGSRNEAELEAKG